MNKDIILITRCCGKGLQQAITLIKRLSIEGLSYDLHSANPKNCEDIIEKCGSTMEIAKKNPHVWIEDILFPAESLNDPKFIDNLIISLKKIKEHENSHES